MAFDDGDAWRNPDGCQCDATPKSTASNDVDGDRNGDCSQTAASMKARHVNSLETDYCSQQRHQQTAPSHGRESRSTSSLCSLGTTGGPHSAGCLVAESTRGSHTRESTVPPPI
eukprot:m.311922 g.311922  ORF g.311922 m.311922 type:complete len:114 (-) comp16392_c0_seq12:1323-1664(-)